MFSFFDSFVDTISTIINFIINFFTGMVHFIAMMAQSLGYLGEVILYLPPFILVFVTAIISLSIIMMIINHGG